MDNKKSKSHGKILVAGGINMDIVTVSSELPGIGEYIYGSELDFIPGGNGLNQSVAAARIGGNVQLVGFIGNDGFGRDMSNFLKNENVDITYLKTINGTHSGSVLFLLANKVERHIVFPGSNMKATVDDLPDVDISSSDIVISQLTIPQQVTSSVFGKAKKSGAKTILNLFPNYEVSKDLLKLCDYIILNEVELAFRTGDTEFVKAQHKDLHMDKAMVLERAKKLRTSANQVIIVTLAERGVIGIKGENLTIVNGIKVKFADATGAGDCFLGAFATGLTEGMDFGDALKLANCAAAISVQKIGATTSFPKREDVDSLLQKQR